MAHSNLRIYISTQEGFPLSTHRHQIAWDRVLEAAKINPFFDKKVKALEGDVEKKEMMLDYIWTGVSQLRGEVVNKACLMFSSVYSIPGSNHTSDEIKDIVKWLVDTGAFSNGGLDIEGRTYDKQQPFCHPVIKLLINNQWFGKKGEGVRFINAFQNMPIALIALVVTALECAIRSYSTGSKSSPDFTESAFRARWLFYHAKLQHLEEKSPKWMKKMQSELFQAILWVTSINV
ncbi:hypothetical protein BJ138DRAFT_1119082 [Hygrophoropsis aurantiaca]|uniref:Uncharacterized protein n=1 Tax=Hygrophoropsis aurantiaca TaxID=72124 RepID=A0ACB7ZUF2_9AGAM|nr:hypothetical protein BJ138DRAFT_1119082 [Hygrophoropsis aurantiaca]